MAALEYRHAQEIRDALARRRVRYLFIGKSGAMVFAPDGIERFEDAWSRRVEVEGFPVCHIDDIIASKQAALPRLRSFREHWIRRRG